MALIGVGGLNGLLAMAAFMTPFGFAQDMIMAALIGFVVAAAKPTKSGAASGARQSAQQFANVAGLAILSGLHLTVAPLTGA